MKLNLGLRAYHPHLGDEIPPPPIVPTSRPLRAGGRSDASPGPVPCLGRGTGEGGAVLLTVPLRKCSIFMAIGCTLLPVAKDRGILWQSKMAMENGSLMGDFRIKPSIDIGFSIAMFDYQRVLQLQPTYPPQALGVVQRLHPNLLLSARRFSVALNAMAIPVDEVPTEMEMELL